MHISWDVVNVSQWSIVVTSSDVGTTYRPDIFSLRVQVLPILAMIQLTMTAHVPVLLMVI